MASIFSGVKKELIEAEGGYSNDPNDSGGETKYGISKASYPKVDIKNLTLDQAYAIYERDYWNPHKLSNINNQEMANKIFLAIVNLGSSKAIICLQKSLIICGSNSIILDGILGPKTMNAVNSAPQNWLLDRFSIELGLYYLSRVDADKTQLKFLRGWLRRVL